MTAWMPAMVAAITVVLGYFVYIFQKIRERKEDLIKIRRIEYRKWIQALYDILATDKQGALLALNTSTNDLFLYASDSVVKSVGSFKNYMAETSGDEGRRDMKTAGILLARVVREMRRDVFVSTALGEDEIRNILPIQGVADDTM